MKCKYNIFTPKLRYGLRLYGKVRTTDLCLFYKGDSTPISLNLYGKTIVSNKTMNVLGVIFDSKMQWSNHIAHAIKRSTKRLNAIKLIKKFFNQRELISLMTSNFYSIGQGAIIERKINF